MGFLRETIKILFIIISVLTGCTNPIALKDARLNDEGLMSYGVNNQRNFYIDKNLDYENLELAWENTTRGSFDNFSVTIYDEFVFSPDLSGRVYVFDRETGKLNGHEEESGEMPVTVNIKNNKFFYFVNNFKETYFTMYIFNYKQGSLSEEIKIKGKCSNEPLQLEDGLLVLTEEGRLLKFDFLGTKVWEYDSKEIAVSDPAYIDGRIYWGSINGNIFSIDDKSGKLNYKNKISENRIEAGITLTNTFGYLSDVEGILYKIKLKDGIVENEISLESAAKNNPIVNGTNLFIGDMSGVIYSIDLNEMEINWSTEVDGVLNANALLFNNVLVQPNLNRKVHFINVENGNIEMEFEYDARVKMTPVFYDYTLYIGIDRGTLFAYKTN